MFKVLVAGKGTTSELLEGSIVGVSTSVEVIGKKNELVLFDGLLTIFTSFSSIFNVNPLVPGVH